MSLFLQSSFVECAIFKQNTAICLKQKPFQECVSSKHHRKLVGVSSATGKSESFTPNTTVTLCGLVKRFYLVKHFRYKVCFHSYLLEVCPLGLLEVCPLR